MSCNAELSGPLLCGVLHRTDLLSGHDTTVSGVLIAWRILYSLRAYAFDKRKRGKDMFGLFESKEKYREYG